MNTPVSGQDARPLVLLPVRAETRFIDTADASELWVRIYPDQIMVNAHHPELTAPEVAAGNAYWDAVWRAGKPPPQQDAVLAPWRGLAARYGGPRAAWIALQTTPLNIAQQPAAPTPDGGTPSPAPQPPDPPAAASAWDSPAVAALLPQSWTVVLEGAAGSATFTGSAVTPDLALSLTGSQAGAFADGMPVDKPMRWLVDFDAAVAAGMAMRIPITSAEREAGFDRMYVYGLSADGGTGLDILLNAHHYSDGLSFVPQGSATKNTHDAPSAYSRSDPGALISFAVERGPALTADPAADGPVTAGMLGVPVATFDHVRYADRYDMRDGQDMVTALWPATIGYFLRQMSDGSLTEAQIEQARTWTIANMRPRGPLPALAAGKMPYGILPATATSLLVPDPGDEVSAAVLRMAQRLLPAWTASAADAPHVGGTPGDPDTDLTHVLGMDASSMTFRGRHFFGDELLWNLIGFMALPEPSQWWEQHLAFGRDQLDAIGFTGWDPRVIHGSLSPDDFPVVSPTVVAGPLSETDPLPADASFGGGHVNYISWLRSASIADIKGNNYPGPAVPDTLLYKILRQSMLLDYVTLAQFAQVADGELVLEQTREAELVGMATAAAEVTPWEVLARPVSAAEPISWAEYLVALQPLPGSQFERLAQLRQAMDRLAALPTAELDRLLTETLDTFSHRLDAWVTALATARLTSGGANGGGIQAPSGNQSASGVRAGGYCFLADLRPATPGVPVDRLAAALVEDLDTRRAKEFPNLATPMPPVQAPAGNGGFVHAPSMTQAATGAVLRSGYLSHLGGDEDTLLSIDLSSDRVRNALYLLSGVRRGQPLGALLGYQLETAMHDAGLDVYVQPLRDAFPLVSGKLTLGGPDTGMSQVTDGLALDRARRDGMLAPGGDWGTGLPGPGADQDSLLGLFAVLDDTVKAISDAGVAEAVYQAMRGNPVRAGGVFDGISQAEQLPDPQVVTTPRGGIDHTQRLCALFAGPPAGAAAWAGIAATPRSAAEPWLDSWLSALLPDPASISAQVSYTVSGPPVVATVHLSELGVRPLDVLAMSRISPEGGRSELDSRIIYQVVPAGATDITVSYPQAAPPGVGVPELLTVARALADLVAGARPLAAADLADDGASVPPGVDSIELNSRASAARDAITALAGSLASAAAGTLAPDTARDALVAAAGYGLPGAIPPSRRGSGADPRLAALAAPLHDAIAARTSAMAGITLAAADPGPALAMLDAAFGKSLLVLPRFAPPAGSLAASLAADPATIGATPDAIARWKQQLTHVRDGMSRFDLALLLAEIIAGATAPPLRIGQLPAVAADRWLALPLAAGAKPARGRVAIMAALTGDPAATSWSGLFVDGWTERLPSDSESAGVAFNAAEPSARAPAAVLLAACPDPDSGWDDTAIVEVLRETLTLAQVRSVDLASVQTAGQVLPALYFPFNLEEDTISLPLWPIMFSLPGPAADPPAPQTGG